MELRAAVRVVLGIMPAAAVLLARGAAVPPEAGATVAPADVLCPQEALAATVDGDTEAAAAGLAAATSPAKAADTSPVEARAAISFLTAL